MIVINYGVPKSASTYNWMLCRDVIVKDSAQRCYSLYNIADVLPDPPYPNFFDPGPFKMDVDIFFKKLMRWFHLVMCYKLKFTINAQTILMN